MERSAGRFVTFGLRMGGEGDPERSERGFRSLPEAFAGRGERGRRVENRFQTGGAGRRDRRGAFAGCDAMRAIRPSPFMEEETLEMKRACWILTLPLFLTSPRGASARTAKKPPAAKSKKAVALCPVGAIPAMTGKKDVRSLYKGKVYYFCCPDCKPAFDKEPEKYLRMLRLRKKRPALKK
jgi:YHS domain-containing protein